jgi:hypothetical protein
MEVTGQQVAIVTGASQGNRGRPCRGLAQQRYSLVANPRTITGSPNSHVRAVAGDIADRVPHSVFPILATQGGCVSVSGAGRRLELVDESS